MVDSVNDRYKKAAGFSPQAAEQAMLARLLIGSKPTAAPNLPFTGLTNTPGLPPFQQPGDEMARFQPPVQPQPSAPIQTQQLPPPQMPPQAAPQMQPMPAPATIAQPGPDPAAPPSDGSVRGDLMMALRKDLPEQWKGSFANQYGEPT